MLYLVVKAAISGIIIALVSEVAKRYPTIGALLLSLPLLSILAFIWLWRDSVENERIAALSQETFWLVLPTLPMFLVFPALLRGGLPFWPSLGIACGITVGLYLLTLRLLPN
jgi:hypothetical protein